MSLIRLVYASRFNQQHNPSELARIQESAERNNKKVDVTGMLIFGEDHFLQCLEGSRDAVSSTFNRITRDSRHYEINVFSVEEITQRDFSEWKMKFVILTEANQKLIKEFSEGSVFNPFLMSAKAAYEFMKAVRNSQVKVRQAA